jgi:hypothetical protein
VSGRERPCRRWYGPAALGLVDSTQVRQADSMSQLPTPVRAAVGLAATLLDRLRQVPDDAPAVPVQIVGAAMQLSLRVQQQIAAYVARGDEVLAHIRGTSEEAPSWATFDEPPTDTPEKPAEDGPPPRKVTAPRAAPKPPAPAKAAGPAPNGAKKTAKKAAKKAAKKVAAPGAAEPAAIRSKSDQTPVPKASPAAE